METNITSGNGAIIPEVDIVGAAISPETEISGEIRSEISLKGEMNAGALILNDYTLTITDIAGGHRLTVRRGSEEQVMDVMDGSMSDGYLMPDQVVFPDGAVTTFPIGSVELVNGKGTLISPGGTLADFFAKLIKVKTPEIAQPSARVRLTQAKEYEVGEYVTPSYVLEFDPGSYEFGPDTGVRAASITVANNVNSETHSAVSGSFSRIQVTKNTSFKITAVVRHTGGAAPKDNMGGNYVAGRIAPGTIEAVSEALTGYRQSYYGTLTSKNTITEAEIKKLPRRGRSLNAGDSFEITIPVGARRVMIAYSQDLPRIKSIIDTGGMHSDIVKSFKVQSCGVFSANMYDADRYYVYYLDFAVANDTQNKYIVTI